MGPEAGRRRFKMAKKEAKEEKKKANDGKKIKFNEDLSAIQDIDFVAANLAYNNAQTSLQTALQSSSNYFSQTLRNFFGG